MSLDVDAVSFTVIVAVRNGARTIERCFESVFEQAHPRAELIVIDGASTDETPAIIERHDHAIAYWESKPDRGIAHAWNKAVDHATGDWLLFLGADDRLHDRDVLADMAGWLAPVPLTTTVAYGMVDVVGSDGVFRRSVGLPWSDVRGDFPSGMTIPHQGTFHRRSLFDRVGGFDEQYRIGADYELLLRELPSNEPLYVDRLIADMGAGGISDGLGALLAIAKETHRARVVHGLTSGPEWRDRAVVRARVIDVLSRTFGADRTERARRTYRAVRGRP